MTRERMFEIGSGAILVVIGVAFAIGALSYDLGNIVDMGPGMFPLIVGLSIATIGVPIMVLAILRRPLPIAMHVAEEPETPDAVDPDEKRTMRSLVIVIGALLVFGALIRTTGMIPAVMAMVILVGLTDRQPKPLRSIIVAAALATVAWLIFIYALGMNIPSFRWGF